MHGLSPQNFNIRGGRHLLRNRLLWRHRKPCLARHLGDLCALIMTWRFHTCSTSVDHTGRALVHEALHTCHISCIFSKLSSFYCRLTGSTFPHNGQCVPVSDVEDIPVLRPGPLSVTKCRSMLSAEDQEHHVYRKTFSVKH